MHVCVHACMYMCTCVRVYAYMNVRMYECMYVCTFVCAWVCTHVCTYILTHLFIYIHGCMCLYFGFTSNREFVEYIVYKHPEYGIPAFNWGIRVTCLSKETYNLLKEPYTLSKESYFLSKEPCIIVWITATRSVTFLFMPLHWYTCEAIKCGFSIQERAFHKHTTHQTTNNIHPNTAATPIPRILFTTARVCRKSKKSVRDTESPCTAHTWICVKYVSVSVRVCECQ